MILQWHKMDDVTYHAEPSWWRSLMVMKDGDEGWTWTYFTYEEDRGGVYIDSQDSSYSVYKDGNTHFEAWEVAAEDCEQWVGITASDAPVG